MPQPFCNAKEQKQTQQSNRNNFDYSEWCKRFFLFVLFDFNKILILFSGIKTPENLNNTKGHTMPLRLVTKQKRIRL